MHIADGILPISLTTGGFGGAAVVVARGIRSLAPANVPRVALLTAGFFVVSLIHVPLWGVSIHLLMHGLLGIVLGPLSGVALAVALALQAILIGHGGITALGVNILSMTFGAMCARMVFDQLGGRGSVRQAWAAGFLAGAVAVWASAMVVFFTLWLAGDNWHQLGRLVLLANIPVVIIEAFVTASAAAFIVRVKPELFTATWSQEHICSLHQTLVSS